LIGEQSFFVPYSHAEHWERYGDNTGADLPQTVAGSMMNEIVSYEADFHAWAMNNARLLRQGRLDELDAEHIAEELESMGASERRELLNRLQVLLVHLLKHQYQPERRGKSWLLTIHHQRTAIERLLEQSPSLKGLLSEENLAKVYAKSVREAVIETDLDRHLFPIVCPYRLDQILSDDWMPDE
jgi:hypothetical protein